MNPSEDKELQMTAVSLAEHAAARYGATIIVVDNEDGTGYNIYKTPADLPKNAKVLKKVKPTSPIG